jgi:hypothetical protein
MKIDRFEDLECWKEARKLTRMVYDVADLTDQADKTGFISCAE